MYNRSVKIIRSNLAKQHSSVNSENIEVEKISIKSEKVNKLKGSIKKTRIVPIINKVEQQVSISSQNIEQFTSEQLKFNCRKHNRFVQIRYRQLKNKNYIEYKKLKEYKNDKKIIKQ